MSDISFSRNGLFGIILLIICLYFFGFFLTFAFILFVFIYYFYKLYTRNKWRFFSIESFESLNIQMYVISLKNPLRLKNIKKQENAIQQLIPIFDGVDGNNLNTQELFKSGFLDKKYKDASGKELRVIGCYLSHLNLLKKVMNDTGYTIIFGDDFNIVKPLKFMDDVRSLLNTILNKVPEFDLLYLGNLNNNKGELVIDNVYKINPTESLWGTHAYVVNNRNIKKIIYHIQHIHIAIDDIYEILGKSGKLNVFVVHPIMVDQQRDIIPSTID